LQIGEELSNPQDPDMSAEKRKAIFVFFFNDFVKTLQDSDSGIKRLSQSIRSFGYFAAVSEGKEG